MQHKIIYETNRVNCTSKSEAIFMK